VCACKRVYVHVLKLICIISTKTLVFTNQPEIKRVKNAKLYSSLASEFCDCRYNHNTDVAAVWKLKCESNIKTLKLKLSGQV
jgi:hypothetical protein